MLQCDHVHICCISLVLFDEVTERRFVRNLSRGDDLTQESSKGISRLPLVPHPRACLLLLVVQHHRFHVFLKGYHSVKRLRVLPNILCLQGFVYLLECGLNRYAQGRQIGRLLLAFGVGRAVFKLVVLLLLGECL